MSCKVPDYFSSYPDFPTYAKDYEEFSRAIISSTHHEYNNVDKEKFLESMVYRNDGKASERVEEFIIKKIGK